MNAAGTVLWRLPGALLGAILFVAAGSMLGPPGLLLALIWLLTGALTGFRFGERGGRYRRAGQVQEIPKKSPKPCPVRGEVGA